MILRHENLQAKISLLAVVFLGLLHIPCFSATYVVAPNGDDNAAGNEAAPFKTLHKARDVATSGDMVLLRGGKYFLGSTLTFGAAHSGVTWRAFNNERVIISGGVKLTPAWETHSGSIMKTTVNVTLTDKMKQYPQMFVNGRKQILARYPNFDPAVEVFNGSVSWANTPSEISPKLQPGVHVHAIHSTHWGSVHGVVVSGSNIEPLDQLNRGSQSISSHHGIYIANRFEDLDSEGEFYLNAGTNTLYFYPPAGLDLNSAEVVLVDLKTLVDFDGTEANPVTNITLLGLEFTESAHAWADGYERMGRGDWSINRGGAVFMDGAENCTIQSCRFDQLGANGVFMSAYNRGHTVSDCIFEYLDESGVCLVGDASSVVGSDESFYYNYSSSWQDVNDRTTKSPANNLYPANCLIHNNLFHHTGVIGKQTAAIFISLSHKITVTHNTIFHLPRAGICTNEGAFGGHIYKHNDVFATVLETGDHGPWNCWGRDRFWEKNAGNRDMVGLDKIDICHIINNRFHGDHSSYGIDLDDGASQYEVANNLVIGVSIKFREGFFRNARNNITIKSKNDIHMWNTGGDEVWEHNIVVSETAYRIAGSFPSDGPTKIDDQLFYNFGGSVTFPGSWGAHDNNSVTADPQFVSPNTGDYTVQAGSPALALGFKNIPMDSFGIITPHTGQNIRIRNNANFSSNGSKNDVNTVTNDILGAEGETGGITSLGVELTSVPNGSEAYTIGLRQGDEVLYVNNIPIYDFRHLGTIMDKRPVGGWSIVVNRGGSPQVIEVAGNKLDPITEVEKPEAVVFKRNPEMNYYRGMLRVSIPWKGDYTLALIDLMGRNIADFPVKGGKMTAFNVSDLTSSGLYFAKLESVSGKFSHAIKFSVINQGGFGFSFK